MNTVATRNVTVELCGSWTVGVGDQDQCLHLWRYGGGYNTLDLVREMFAKDEVGHFLNHKFIVVIYLYFKFHYGNIYK